MFCMEEFCTLSSMISLTLQRSVCMSFCMFLGSSEVWFHSLIFFLHPNVKQTLFLFFILITVFKQTNFSLLWAMKMIQALQADGVHIVFSTKLTGLNISNELRNGSLFPKKYQFWKLKHLRRDKLFCWWKFLFNLQLLLQFHQFL